MAKPISLPRLEELTLLIRSHGWVKSRWLPSALARVNVFALHSFLPNTDDEHVWTEAFQDASGLRIIGRGSSFIENLIHALQPHDGRVLVPALTDIRFLEIEFRRSECLGGPDRDGKGCLQCLHSAQASRAWVGIVLQ